MSNILDDGNGFIVPLEGFPGPRGKSAYQSWLDLGNSGSEADFIKSLSSSSVAVSWETRTAAGAVLSGSKIQADTSAGSWTQALPLNAPEGATIWFADPKGAWNANPLTLTGNGHNFEDGTGLLICDEDGQTVQLVVANSVWSIVHEAL